MYLLFVRKRIMEFRSLYSLEELRQLRDWFVSHRENVPQQIRVDKATYYKDVPFAIESIIGILDNVKETNENFGGLYYTFFLLKEKLEEELKD